MLTPDSRSRLVEILADLFPDVDTSRTVVDHAGIRSDLVGFDAKRNWSAILRDSEQHGGFSALLEEALRRYPQRSDLGELIETVRSEITGLVSTGQQQAATAPTGERHDRELLRAAVSADDKLYLVLDIGGTKAYASLMDTQARRLFDKRFTTAAHDEHDHLFDFIYGCITESLDRIQAICSVSRVELRRRVAALGIAFAGPTDHVRGLIRSASNFEVQDFPLREKMEAEAGIPTFVDNDANLAVLGEHWKGVAKDYGNIVSIVIGTGIGGGIMIDGRLYRGRNDAAGEIGHMIVDQDSDVRCGCGQFGCFEALASRSAIARELHKVKAGRRSSLGVAGDPRWDESTLASNAIAYHYRQGDRDTVRLVNEAAAVCGKAVFSILNLFNPEIVVFSGGFVRQLGDEFLVPVRREASKCMNAVYALGDETIPMKIGMDSPILAGACKMAMDGAAGRLEQSVTEVLTGLLDGLEPREREVLRSLYYHGNAPVVPERDSGFAEDRLRKLRNRGLIRTVGGPSFRTAREVGLTPLGRIVVGQMLT